VVRSAQSGAGIHGTFTAQRLNCVQHPGHVACGWEGGFRSADGRTVKPDVYLYGGAGDLTAGGSIPARDVGRSGQVYRFAGTHEWILSALLSAGGLLLVGFALRRAVRRQRIEEITMPHIDLGN